MHTAARDKALLDEIAAYFDMLAGDSQAFADRGLGNKRENKIRSKCWTDAAADIRRIKLI
tara:strand:- start:28649 stop:28828 length:180 start_codon:yes stop_codon:yes gene_type:complete